MNYEVYIEESSLVRVLGTVIDEIYLKEDYTIVSRWNGAVPEDIMMKILIYGYMNSAFSSRKIEQLCKRDIHFWWLLDGFNKPDHCTISRFRQKMGDQIEKVFYAAVKYLLNAGEISGKNLFIDGTKIEANANRYSFVWKKAVTKNEQKQYQQTYHCRQHSENDHYCLFHVYHTPLSLL
jgi:transposase